LVLRNVTSGIDVSPRRSGESVALQTKITPLSLDQQAFARKRQRVVVEAGFVDRRRLDQSIAAHKRCSRRTRERRSRPTTGGQRLVSGELQV